MKQIQGGHSSMGRGCLQILQGLKTLSVHHELLVNMVYREIQAHYRQSMLGMAWAVIKPAATLATVTVIFSLIIKLPSDHLPYPLFAIGALLPWTFFSSAVSAGIPSLTNQANLVTKIYFPREILPFAAIAASTLDFLIYFLFLGGMMIFYQVPLSWNLLFVFPILFIEILLILGITLFLSMLNVWYRDITAATGLMLQLWMYLTPIIYPLSMVPEKYLAVYSLNPLVGVVEGFRCAVIRGESPDWRLLTISSIAGIFVFLFGYGIFKAREFDFADVI